MLRNCLAAALRNLARNRLYAGVTIAGLAIGLAAALLIGLYVRDELTFDRWVPGHERIYQVTNTIGRGAGPPIETKLSQIKLAKLLKAEFPEIETAARLSGSYFPPAVRRGDFTATEQNLYWTDSDFFRIFPLPTVAGDLRHALDAPDEVVLTRAIARKYFGRDAPIGETLHIDRQPFRVTAVVEDLPSNTNLTAEIFAASRSTLSPITRFEPINGPLDTTLFTFVKLRPGASTTTVTPRIQAFLDRRLPLVGFTSPVRRNLNFVPITRVHLTPDNQAVFGAKPPADPAILAAIATVGVLIVVVAAINFVTLMTARAGRRAVEVGVRKVAGARRRDLILQFIGEAAIYVAAAGVLALSLAELSLPAVNALLQRKLRLDYLHDPTLIPAVIAALLAVAVLAGAYPAFVLSSFRPAAVLKGGRAVASAGGRLRQVLVVAQFAVLVGLALVATTIARQTLFALNEGLRLDKDQVALIFSNPCSEAMRDEARRLPGVRAAGCAFDYALDLATSRTQITIGGRKINDVKRVPVDFGFFDVFSIKPVAGRLFDQSRPADGALDSLDSYQPVVLNATAARRFGFATPEAAIGTTILWQGIWDPTKQGPVSTIAPTRPSEVIGVVPDFTLGSVRNPIEPTLYAIGRNAPPDSVALAVKLDGRQVPETLAAIDRLWKRLGDGRPILRVFVDQFTMRLYVDTIIQGATVAIAGLIAVTIAALGLFALSAYTTERRTKEIGVRKALGASSGDILRLLLWQFAKPVIWANLIAWPAAWLILRWWLSGFAYRVDIAPWTFVAAGGGALLLALATVFVHALDVARAKPAGALRYE
jgi:putative ABC transport system permease protein